MLIETYRQMRHSLVAFVPRFSPDAAATRRFPQILGTGFVVHEDGLIATSQHVIDLICRLPRPGYAPADLLKHLRLIYGYLNRVRSSRRLEMERGRST
jgi:hypothetical protein